MSMVEVYYDMCVLNEFLSYHIRVSSNWWTPNGLNTFLCSRYRENITLLCRNKVIIC